MMRSFTFLRLTPEMLDPAYHSAWQRFMHGMRNNGTERRGSTGSPARGAGGAISAGPGGKVAGVNGSRVGQGADHLAGPQAAPQRANSS